jgi:hypothetical protein
LKTKRENILTSAAVLSFRAPLKFAEHTRDMALSLKMSASDYVREAVREKNERALNERIVFLSRYLSAAHWAENDAMGASVSDGLKRDTVNGRA